MPEFDLSTLSGPELRSLLDSTRKRGQAAQAYRILQEMDARRTRDGARSAGERQTTISVDLGDPLDRRDELLDAAPAAPEPLAAPDSFDAELALAVQEHRPRRKSTPKPSPKPRRAKREREPSWDEATRTPRAPRKRSWAPLGFAASAVLGVLIGAGIARETFLAPPTPAAAVFPQAPMLQIDSAPAAPPAETMPPQDEVAGLEAPAMETMPSPEPEVAAEVASASTPASVVEPAKPEVAAEPIAIPASAPEPEKTCAGPPADRVICEEPRLQRLQKELRQAYADALEAHEDRATLRQRQLAWRDARNAVSDPEALARLYQDRIRKLNAAAAQARRARERGGKDA